jgi:TetR/AcrR family fatty acid metabolism transcriptional regulator
MRNKNSDKHQRILDAAVKVFAQKGFFQSKVSEIAREAGVADGTVYLYFKNKDDLLISIFEEKMRDVITQFRSAISREKDARSRFKTLIRMHLASFQADPDLAAVLQVELRQSSRFMREYKKTELKRYLDIIGEIVEQGQKEGVFRRDFPTWLVKRFIFGTLDEVVSTWVQVGKGHDLESNAEFIIELFLRGIQSEPSESKENTPGGSKR